MTEEDTQSSILPPLQPRDILSPSATLLGFIIASLGIIIGFAGEQSDFLNNVLPILIITVILIVISAFLTILSSLTRRSFIWQLAKISYSISWLFLGYIAIMILLGKILGVESLQIQMPQFNIELVSVISGALSIGSTLISVFKLRQVFRKELETATEKIKVTSTQARDQIKETIDRTVVEEDFDKEMSLVRLTIEMERIIRDIISLPPFSYNQQAKRQLSHRKILSILESKNILSKDFSNAYLSIWNVRNTIVHGGQIYKKELDIGLELAAKLNLELNNIKERLQVAIKPSYPSDGWEFLWFRYTGDNTNPWGEFLERTIKSEINFDDNWHEGEVSNTGQYDYVGFMASRTIRLFDSGLHRFIVGGDDGIRLIVYSNEFDEIFRLTRGWRDQDYTRYTQDQELPEGEYKILLEWYERTGAARVSFTISAPRT